MKLLETERLILRAWTFYDLDDLYAYAVNPNIGPSAGWKPHASREESLEVLCQFIDQKQDWAIVDKQSSRAIGSIGLRPDPKRNLETARLMGYVLSEEYWGKGLATEAALRVVEYAFEGLFLDVLAIAHYPFNARSKRVIEKCGFHYEGTLRQSTQIYSGEVYDQVCYSLLRSEYYAGR